MMDMVHVRLFFPYCKRMQKWVYSVKGVCAHFYVKCDGIVPLNFGRAMSFLNIKHSNPTCQVARHNSGAKWHIELYQLATAVMENEQET